MPATFDLVISELLDSTLLGEGYLASLRDLARRGFLRPGGWDVGSSSLVL